MRLDRVHDTVGFPVALGIARRDERVRALFLVRQRLAEVVQQRRPFRGLDAGAELGGHDARQVHDLERVLEDVLAVTRSEFEAAEDLHELLVKLAAMRLEDGLLAGLTDEVVDLGLRLVVRLLYPGGMDASVLEQLLERQLRDLAPHAVERREDDRLRRVVDDEVDAGEVLERADVAALPPDDPALHVVGGKLDDRHRRFGGVAGRDTLQRVGDEVPGTSPRLDLRLLLELTDAPSEIVPDELFGARQDLVLRLAHGQPGDPLELRELAVLRLLELFLELLDVSFAVGDSLLAPLDVDQPALALVLARVEPLTLAEDVGPLPLQLALDLGAVLDRGFLRLELGLAAERLRLLTGLGDQQLPRATCGREL